MKETTSRAATPKAFVSTAKIIPLELVLRACPEIKAYAASGIRSWRDLVDASRLVSSFLGISNAAYIEAVRVFGLENASGAIAAILQKAGAIESPGGYLRSLVQKAREGSFSVIETILNHLKAQKQAHIRNPIARTGLIKEFCA